MVLPEMERHQLGVEFHLCGNAGLAPALLIIRPVLRQMEPISYRQAGMMIGQ
jgi:hypothetical protein